MGFMVLKKCGGNMVLTHFHIIQRDSKGWTQFHTSIFPELYMVCE